MSLPTHLSFKYHTQDLGNYCGAAVASMILSRNNPAPVLLDQDHLWAIIQADNLRNLPRNWATEPGGLAKILTDLGQGLSYIVYQAATKEEGSMNILNSLRQFNSPAAALVYTSAHWIAVNGVQTNNAGPNPQIEGFWVQDPFFHSPLNPPPHSSTDPCGTGKSLGDDDQFWPYDSEWLAYFRGCRYDDAQIKFISVGPAVAENAIAANIGAPVAPPAPPPAAAEKLPLADGVGLITPKQAIEFSQLGLREYNLYQNDFIDQALREATPGKPILVHESDRLNTYYYLVPLEIEKAVIVYTKVDARFGIFRGLQLLTKPLRNSFISKEQALKLVLGRRFELPNVTGRVMLFPGTAMVLPTLAWRPCLESMSSYLPFYQVTMGAHIIYVRVDGEVFTTLTPAAFGGYPEDGDMTWPKKP